MYPVSSSTASASQPGTTSAGSTRRLKGCTGVSEDGFGEPGSVGQWVLRYAGYKAWTDGWQYAALDPAVMGIVDD